MAAARKARSHKVLVTLTTNRAITARQARLAVWNAVHDLKVYGMDDNETDEPFGDGTIRVSRSAPRTR